MNILVVNTYLITNYYLRISATGFRADPLSCKTGQISEIIIVSGYENSWKWLNL